MTLVDYYQIDRIGNCGNASVDMKFFLKYGSAFLPRVYFDLAANFSRRYSIQFSESWACECQNLLRELSIPEEFGEVGDYLGGHRHWLPIMPAVSFRCSEVYQSAFLRTLAWYRKKNKIPESVFLNWSLYTCPVDLSFWEIESRDPPSWWPRIPYVSSDTGQPSQNVEVYDWKVVRTLVRGQTETFGSVAGRFLAVEGPCLWADNAGYDNLTVSFSLIPFAYKLCGPERPIPERVGRFLCWKTQWHPDYKSQFPFSVFDASSEIQWSTDETQMRESDLHTEALVSRLREVACNQWQWYRHYAPPWGLAHFLASKGCILDHDEKSWFYVCKGRKVAIGYDWRMGCSERQDRAFFTPCGQALEVDSDWLEHVLGEADLRLAYLLRVEVRTRKYSSDEPQVHTHHEFIGLSQVLTP